MAEREKLIPHLIYGDGTFAVFRSMKEIEVTENDIKETFYEFYLRPTTKARIKWNVTENDESFMDKGEWLGYYKKTYRKDYCYPLDLSPDSAVWLLSCDYQGNFIDIYNGEKTKWLQIIKTLRNQNTILRASNNSLAYEMTKMLNNPLGYLKKYGKHIKDLLDNVAGPIMPPPQGDGND